MDQNATAFTEQDVRIYRELGNGELRTLAYDPLPSAARDMAREIIHRRWAGIDLDRLKVALDGVRETVAVAISQRDAHWSTPEEHRAFWSKLQARVGEVFVRARPSTEPTEP